MQLKLPSRRVVTVLAIVAAGSSLFGLSGCRAAADSTLATPATIAPATPTSIFGQANIQVTYRSPFDRQTTTSATPYLAGARSDNSDATPTPSSTPRNTTTPAPSATLIPPSATPVPLSPEPEQPTRVPLTPLRPTNTPTDAVLAVAMNTSFSDSVGVSAPLQQNLMQRMANTPRAHLRAYLSRVFDLPAKASLWRLLGKTLTILRFVTPPEPEVVVPAAPIVVNPPDTGAPVPPPGPENHANPAPPEPPREEPPRQEQPPPPPPEQPPAPLPEEPPPPPPPEAPAPPPEQPPPPPPNDSSGRGNGDNKSDRDNDRSGGRNPDDSSGSRNGDNKSGSGSGS